MEITKKNGEVCFNDETHTYWNENDNGRYISVTTLIGKYAPPFNSEFWSGYKALEKLLTPESWAIERKQLLNTKKIDKNLFSIYDINENDFNKVQQDILDEWEAKKQASCERGTKIHAMIENTFYNAGKNVSLKKFGIGGKFECRKDYTELDMEYGVYPEYLIYWEDDKKELRIAGQIDLLIKNGNHITIIDHKTNEKIETKGHFNKITKSNEKMLYPLNNLDECEYSHYDMQLSTYAWMLQKLNPDFIIDKLIINHYDHNNKNTIYECPYLKNEVELMLKHYKKQQIREKQEARRKPIEY
jgi:hypothetical protein